MASVDTRISSTASIELVNNTTTLVSDSKNDLGDVLFDRKVEIASEGLISCYSKCFHKIPSKKNALILADYVIAMKSEINLADNYRREVIQKLSGLSIYHGKISFKDMTRQQILDLIIYVNQKLQIHFTNG